MVAMGRKRGPLISGVVVLLLGAAVAFFLLRKSDPRSVGVTGDAAGEMDLAEPFPEVPETGPEGPFEMRLSDNSRVIGRYSSSGRDGQWLRLSDGGGLLVQGTYRNGALHGEWSTYYRDTGQLRESGSYDDGLAVGTWEMYYPAGPLFEVVEFQAGEQHGPWTMHHPDGSLADEMTWERGEQVGVETDYAPDGRVIAKGSFEAHRPTGTWTCFEADGTTRSLAAPTERLTPRQACGFGMGPEEPDDGAEQP